jgi:hypothetical protein
VSRFDEPLDATIEILKTLGKSRNRQQKRRWSTSDADSYGDLVEQFSGEDQNTDFVKLYAKDKSSDDGASASIQTALKAQVQFLAVFRRALRMKLMVGADAREFSSVDHDRYAYNNGAIGLKKMLAVKNAPDINPSDEAISNATQESSSNG